MMYNTIFERKILLPAFTLGVACFVQAQTTFYDSQRVKYEIISEDARTIKVIQDEDVTATKPKGEITLPTKITHNGKQYTLVELGAGAFFNNAEITGVTIPDTVAIIGRGAFYGCSGISSVELLEGLEEIQSQAFEGCSSLQRITIPASVTSIGQRAFIDCNGMIAYNVRSANPNYSSEEGVLFNKDKTILMRYPSQKNKRQVETEPLGAYTILEGVQTIDVGAFEGALIEIVNIPNSVTKIEEAGFLNAARLQNIEIPNSVTTIGGLAFMSCLNLQNVKIPASVTSIGNQAFHLAGALVNIEVAEENANYSSLAGVLFNKAKTTLIHYPMGISQEEYTFPSSVRQIGPYAFAYNRGVKKINMSKLDTIHRYAFWGNASLSEITTHASVPPTLDRRNPFGDNILSKITLKVPTGSAEKYKAVSVWKEFKIEEDGALSVENVVKKSQNIKIYPNPIKENTLFIDNLENLKEAEILNIAGQVVKKQNLTSGTNAINVSHLSSGIYLVKIGNQTYKVIKP